MILSLSLMAFRLLLSLGSDAVPGSLRCRGAGCSSEVLPDVVFVRALTHHSKLGRRSCLPVVQGLGELADVITVPVYHFSARVCISVSASAGSGSINSCAGSSRGRHSSSNRRGGKRNKSKSRENASLPLHILAFHRSTAAVCKG